MPQVTLRPSGTGDETNISYAYPSMPHYIVTGDQTNTTYVYVLEELGTHRRDLYVMESSPVSTGSIVSVSAYMRCNETPTGSMHAAARNAIKSGTTVAVGNEVTLTSSITDYHTTWYNNPADGLPWEWSDIASIQAGVSLRGYFDDYPVRCYEVWLVISYSDYSESSFTSTGYSGASFVGEDGAPPTVYRSSTLTSSGGSASSFVGASAIIRDSTLSSVCSSSPTFVSGLVLPCILTSTTLTISAFVGEAHTGTDTEFAIVTGSTCLFEPADVSVFSIVTETVCAFVGEAIEAYSAFHIYNESVCTFTTEAAGISESTALISCSTTLIFVGEAYEIQYEILNLSSRITSTLNIESLVL